MHIRPEAESRESPRESEKKIQGPKKSESQSKLKMRREIGDGASCFKGLGHDFAPTAEAVVNQPLDCKRCSRRFKPQNNMRRLPCAVATKLRLSLPTRHSQALL